MGLLGNTNKHDNSQYYAGLVSTLTDVAVFHCIGGIIIGMSVINLVAGLGLKTDSWCNLKSSVTYCWEVPAEL